MDYEVRNTLTSARECIRSLRRQIGLQQAQLRIVDIFAAALMPAPPPSQVEPDMVWRIDQLIDEQDRRDIAEKRAAEAAAQQQYAEKGIAGQGIPAPYPVDVRRS